MEKRCCAVQVTGTLEHALLQLCARALSALFCIRTNS